MRLNLGTSVGLCRRVSEIMRRTTLQPSIGVIVRRGAEEALAAPSGRRSIALTRLVARSTMLLGPAAAATVAPCCLVLLRPMSLTSVRPTSGISTTPAGRVRRGQAACPARRGAAHARRVWPVGCARLLPASVRYNDSPSNALTSPTHVRQPLVADNFRLRSPRLRAVAVVHQPDVAPPSSHHNRTSVCFELTAAET